MLSTIIVQIYFRTFTLVPPNQPMPAYAGNGGPIGTLCLKNNSVQGSSQQTWGRTLGVTAYIGSDLLSPLLCRGSEVEIPMCGFSHGWMGEPLAGGVPVKGILGYCFHSETL